MSFGQLGDNAEILSGFAFKSELFNADGEGMPLIRIRDVVSGQTSTFYSGEYESRFIVRSGEILIGMDGDFNRARWRGQPSLLNQRVCKITAHSRLHDGYLFHLLPQLLQVISDRTPFVTVKHLSAKDLRETEIPLPPLEEQKRIAAILDQADALRRLRARALDRINALGQAIFHEMFGRTDIPKRRLKDVGIVTTGGTPPTSEASYYGTEVPFVTPGDLNTGLPAKRYLSREGAAIVRTVAEGSALVCCIGATIGKMDTARSTVAFNQQINAVSWQDEIDPDYGFFALEIIRPEIERQGRGASTTLPILKKSSFEKLELAVPPMDQQKAFARKIAELQKVKADNVRLLASATALFSALQQRAFSGQI